MSEQENWSTLRDRRMQEPGAESAYEAAKLAYELGAAVRDLRQDRGWSQSRLATEAGMTQSAVARFEAGGSVPTLVLLERLARALQADLIVQVRPRPEAA